MKKEIQKFREKVENSWTGKKIKRLHYGISKKLMIIVEKDNHEKRKIYHRLQNTFYGIIVPSATVLPAMSTWLISMSLISAGLWILVKIKKKLPVKGLLSNFSFIKNTIQKGFVNDILSGYNNSIIYTYNILGTT